MPSTTPDIGIAAFCDSGFLQKRLSEVFRGVPTGDAVVGVSIASRTAFAAVDSGAKLSRASDSRIHPGCLSKLITSSMLEGLVASRTLERATVVTEIFGSQRGFFPWDKLSLRHLTDHTHGLNDSECAELSSPSGVSMNFADMAVRLSQRAIALPGELYSYSHAGAWVSAAILERFHGCTYADLLWARYATCLELKSAPMGAWNLDACVSPATGRGVTVSVGGLMRFLDCVRDRADFWPSLGDNSCLTPLSGWNPLELAVYRGWKALGDGWFGHSSYNDDGSTALVRIHPLSRASIVVASKRHNSSLLATKVFGRILPFFANGSFPRMLGTSTSLTPEQRALCGIYKNGLHTLSVSTTDDRGLLLSGNRWEVPLMAADNGLMLAPGAESKGVGFVQGIRRSGDSFNYLWDGRRLFKNLLSDATPLVIAAAS